MTSQELAIPAVKDAAGRTDEMRIQKDNMKILFYIATAAFCFCALFFLTSFFAVMGTKNQKTYKKGEATLLRVVEPRGKDEDLCYEIAYSVDGVAYKAKVSLDNTEGITPKTPVGSQVPIWYDPDHPGAVIITEDPTMGKTVESWKRTRKCSLIGMLIFLAILVPTFPKDEEGLPRNVTTIGQFSQELSALAEKQPDNRTDPVCRR